ncbi:hypothetical protein GGR56DRAFT_669394 [Xylariaceae sp. FL0804]|nr:hypothetical protein GGR56DRAFT_669394 [Xylariaceae sp. FL0804]
MAITMTSFARSLTLIVLLVSASAQTLHVFDEDTRLQHPDHEDDLGGSFFEAPDASSSYAPAGSLEERAGPAVLDARLDLPGGVDLDSLADSVYGKVSAKVNATVSDAESGLGSAVDTAKRDLNETLSAAKGALQDVEQKVEQLYEQVKDKVAQLERELSATIREWVWEHVGKPLLTLAVILLTPVALLFLWWFAHLVATPFAREPARAGGSLEMRNRGPGGGPQYDGDQAGAGAGAGGGGGAGGGRSYVMFKEKRRVRKEISKLRSDVDELWRMRNREWQESRGQTPNKF